MIEIYLKYDNMHTFGMINAFVCINNHVISCINNMHTFGMINAFVCINNHVISCINNMLSMHKGNWL